MSVRVHKKQNARGGQDGNFQKRIMYIFNNFERCKV